MDAHVNSIWFSEADWLFAELANYVGHLNLVIGCGCGWLSTVWLVVRISGLTVGFWTKWRPPLNPPWKTAHRKFLSYFWPEKYFSWKFWLFTQISPKFEFKYLNKKVKYLGNGITDPSVEGGCLLQTFHGGFNGTSCFCNGWYSNGFCNVCSIYWHVTVYFQLHF